MAADNEATGIYPFGRTVVQMTRYPQQASGPVGTLGSDVPKPAVSDARPEDWSTEALHSAVLDTCMDAIVAHTLDGELLYANPAALSQWRCSSLTEARERGPWGWIPLEHRPKAAGRMDRIRQHGEARFDSISWTREGVSHTTEVHARCVDTPHGPLVVSVVRDLSARQESEEAIKYLAYHDELTGLANRALFNEQLLAALESARCEPRLVGLLYIDLDHFKPVNDVHGHAVGDAVLYAIANRIMACVRRADTVARVGGDEFTVLIPSVADEEELRAVQARIHEAICHPVQVGSTTVAVTPSIGSAIHVPGESTDAFIARADQAMFDARLRTGRFRPIRQTGPGLRQVSKPRGYV